MGQRAQDVQSFTGRGALVGVRVQAPGDERLQGLGALGRVPQRPQRSPSRHLARRDLPEDHAERVHVRLGRAPVLPVIKSALVMSIADGRRLGARLDVAGSWVHYVLGLNILGWPYG